MWPITIIVKKNVDFNTIGNDFIVFVVLKRTKHITKFTIKNCCLYIHISKNKCGLLWKYLNIIWIF